MNAEHLFDQLIDALQNAGAEGGTFAMHFKDNPQGTFLLLDSSDRAFGDCNIIVYKIENKADFIQRLRDRLGEEDFNVYDDEVQDIVWEELQRKVVVEFDEF